VHGVQYPFRESGASGEWGKGGGWFLRFPVWMRGIGFSSFTEMGFSQVVMVFLPKVIFALFAPLREEMF
jgi:hypothetical protein